MSKILFYCLIILSLTFCQNTDYYSLIKKDCNLEKAREYYIRLEKGSDKNLMKIIDAMIECKSEEMERFLSDRYTTSSEKIKGYIYNKLTQGKSRVFLDTVLSILINKIQTNQDYSEELNYIREIDPSFLGKKYDEYIKKLEESKKNKNLLALDVYSENIRALSKVLNRGAVDDKVQDEVKKIKSELEREELYSKFVDATMNQEMSKAYNIFKRLKQNGHLKSDDRTKRLEEILKSISEVEDKFYETASRQDNLMIEIEKRKRMGEDERVKELENELSSVKSEMVFKKRALDRAAKKLELVRELFEEVK